MKITFKFIIFLIYVILLFWVKNLYVFLGIFIFQMLLIKITNISFKKAIKNIINLLPFIIFTAVFNLLTMGWKSSIQITIRLILICNITYINYIMCLNKCQIYSIYFINYRSFL